MFERQQSPVRSSESRAVVKPEQRSSHPRNPLLVQQRALGNQAVQRLLLSGTLQAKLRIGQPNDPYEREADRVADTVMKMPEVMNQGTADASEGGIRTGPLAGAITPVVQRQTAAAPEREEDEDPLRAEPAQAPPAIQRAANGPGITYVRDAALARRLRSPDGGTPLPGNTRNVFERRFGYDFSEVRVHDAYRDGADASTLNARAFTYGRHIWLGHGESTSDIRLMAHELTHVVQQGAGVRRTPLVSGSVAPRIQGSWWDSVTEAVGGAISSLGELAGAAKNRVLGQLTEWARRIPGFDLLTVILGRDPISDQPVERNAINLIRGVLGLVPGGTTMFDNLQRAGAIERAFEWFNAEIAKLNLTWELIKGLFRTAWDSLSLSDILDPANAIARVARIFAPPLARLRDFALAAGRKVLEFVFEGALSLAGVDGARVLGIMRRAGAVFSTIINDPIGFLRNLISALRGGFERFSANILAHLRTGLMEWLFGALSGAGLTLPDRFDLRGIISIVLQVLGLTYARMRAKLVDLIGERNVAFIEGVFDFLVTIVTGGLGAAWEKIVEFAGNLQETIIGGIRDWVARTIVGQAIKQLVTMFNPVGALIQGIMTIYNTVKFFIERAKQIAALAEAVFDSIANIAAGNLAAAINYVERTMARTLPVIISFLASLIGLGGISDRIKDIIKRIQAPVNRAIDQVASFIVGRVQGLLSRSTERAPEKPLLDGTPPVGFEATSARTRLLLLNRLRSEYSREEANQVVAQTFTEVRPWGVRNLEVGPENEDGHSEILIDVNPKGPVASMLPVAQRATMRVITRVTVEPSFNLDPSQMSRMTRPATIEGRQVGFAQFAASRAGAAIIMPPSGTPELRVESWNVNERSMHDSTSHAERQMVEWLGEQSWLNRITHIRVENYPFNPCRVCGGELIALLETVNRARRAAGRPEVHGELTWNADRPWRNELRSQGIAGTGDLAIERINGTISMMNATKKWTVTPLSVSAAGQQWLKKGFEIK